MNILLVISVCFVGHLVFAAPTLNGQLSRQKRQYGNQYQEAVENAYREAEQRYEEEQQNAYREAEQQYEQQVQDEYQREVDEYNQQQQAAQDAYVQQQEEMAREAAERYGAYGGGYRYGRSIRQKRSIPQNQIYMPTVPIAATQQHYPQAYSVNVAARQYPTVVSRPDTYVVGAHPAIQMQQTYPAVEQYSCLDFLEMIFRLLLQDRIDALGNQIMAATAGLDDYYDYDDDSVDFSWETEAQSSTQIPSTTATTVSTTEKYF